MEDFFTKYKSQVIMALGFVFIARSIYKMLHGNVTFVSPSPEGFDKDYITTVWVSKVVFLIIGAMVLILGFLISRKRVN